MLHTLAPSCKHPVSLIKGTIDIATTLIDNLVSKIESLEMDESTRNHESILAITPYKIHEKRSADSTFFC